MTGVAADEDRDGAFVPERIADATRADAARRGGRRDGRGHRARLPRSAARTCRSLARTSSCAATADVDAGVRPPHPGRDPGAGLLMALRWVLFDLNGTLVDTAVMAQPLGDSAADEDARAARRSTTRSSSRWWSRSRAREAVFSELVRRGPAAAAAAGRPRPVGAPTTRSGCWARCRPSSTPRRRSSGCAAIGLRLGVLTQSADEAADAVLRFAGLRDRIEIVISAPESGAFKPDPRPYRLALERIGGHGGRGRARRRALVGRGRRQGAPGCARAGSRAATSCCPTACPSPTSAAATCSRSRRDCALA